jgi:guanylate kinase
MLRDRVADLDYSISYTTRPPRNGETDGVDYHFVSRLQFEQGIESGRWAEWARVHGNYYGTSVQFIRSRLSKGRDVLMDIDVQGAAKILESQPDSVTIFIMPPSLEALKSRLDLRALDSEAAIATRLANAQAEMAASDCYRHVIVNERLADALDLLGELIDRYRCGPGSRDA